MKIARIKKIAVIRPVAIIILVIISAIAVIAPPDLSAHLAGQPPYFKVNGSYVDLYPVPLTSLPDFPLPQDSTSENYLVNQTVNFEFDLSRLPAPKEVIEKTKFSWDFGDGSAASGLSNSHIYKTPGSYHIVIKADDNTTPTPQILESTLIHVLPDRNYTLPKAIIKVNSQKSSDPLTDILEFSFGQNMEFDASDSEGNIVSYFWDFGDQKSSTKKIDTHFYPGDVTQVFPVLRVRDSQGFISDSFVQVQNKDQRGFLTNSQPQAVAKRQVRGNQLHLVLASLVLIVGAFMVLQFVRGRYRGKR
jgi:hypothetical protein